MRPYGVLIIEHPDVADIQAMGAKGSVGKFPGKGGDYRGYARGDNKRRTRRLHKRRARRDGRTQIREQLRD